MDFGVALAILGFSRGSVLDESIIRKAWKIRIARVHPDKSSDPRALQSSQAINEAKDVLLGVVSGVFGKVSKEWDEEEQERLAKKRDRDEHERLAEQRKKDQEEAHQASLRKFEEDYDAHWNRVKAMRRANHARNRKPRAPGSRIHKKIEDYDEGKALINRIKNLVVTCFEEKTGARVLCSELLEVFTQSNMEGTEEKDKANATLEQRLFVRHAKRLFMEQWPNAKYTLYKNQRCYLNVCLKE
jgi:hypothetical protein